MTPRRSLSPLPRVDVQNCRGVFAINIIEPLFFMLFLVEFSHFLISRPSFSRPQKSPCRGGKIGHEAVALQSQITGWNMDEHWDK